MIFLLELCLISVGLYAIFPCVSQKGQLVKETPQLSQIGSYTVYDDTNTCYSYSSVEITVHDIVNQKGYSGVITWELEVNM